MNVFKVTDTEGRTTVYRIPEEDGAKVTIGRSEQSDIALPMDACLSRTHCEVRHWGGLLYLRDCHSSNGTYLDGERIQEEMMLPGRVFHLGQCVIGLAEDWEEVYAVSPFGEELPPPPPVEEVYPAEEPAPEPVYEEESEVPPPPPVEEYYPAEEPAPEPVYEEPAEEPAPEPVDEEPAEEPAPEPVDEEPAEEPAPEPAAVPPMPPMPGHKMVKMRRTKRQTAPVRTGKGGKKAVPLVCSHAVEGAPGADWGLPVDFPCKLTLLTTTPELWEGACLQFAFCADKDCYLHLLQWEAAGHLDVLVGPEGLEKDCFVPAGAERPFPPVRDSEYDFVVEAPFGEDLVVAVACDSPRGLEAALRAAMSAPEAGGTSPETALRHAIADCSTGGERWSCSVLHLVTHEGLRPGGKA